MKTTGNTILITGGTSGIGRALAEALHERGNEVIVTGRRQNLLDEITAAHPGIIGLPLDLNNLDSVEHLAATVRERFPTLNVVFANAGISRSENMLAAGWSSSAAEDIVATNIIGVIRIATALLPLLMRQRNATFVATSSALAFLPRADFPTYCATKAFLHSWLVSLRHQLRKSSVEVLELSPPYVQTEITGAQQASDPRAMPLDVYAAQVMDLLVREDHPRGEILLERDKPRRWAERDGSYDALFAAMNPT